MPRSAPDAHPPDRDNRRDPGPGAAGSARRPRRSSLPSRPCVEPAELRVPAGKKIRLTIDNQDSSAEEFESHELNREKIVPGKSKAVIYVGPLDPGRYPFFGDFNPALTRGVLIAE